MILLLVGCGGGLLLLTIASDYFVVGSARLATRLRVSPVFIGVAVIGFGTSAPELLVSGLAAAQDRAELAIGNVVGSNAANMTLVLGIAGLLAVVPVRSAVLRWEAPLSVASVMAFAALVPGGLNLVEGAVLLGLLVVAVWLLLRAALAGKGEFVDAMAGRGHRVRRRHHPSLVAGLSWFAPGLGWWARWPGHSCWSGVPVDWPPGSVYRRR